MSESALERLRWEAREKGVGRKAETFRKKQIEKEKAEHVQLTKVIYVGPLVSRVPTTKDIWIFEQEQRSRELEEELEATQNFLRKTTTFTTKPTT